MLKQLLSPLNIGMVYMDGISKHRRRLKKRGCVIVRKIAVDTADAAFVRETWKVPNCRSLICTVREVWKGKKQMSCTKRYRCYGRGASEACL